VDHGLLRYKVGCSKTGVAIFMSCASMCCVLACGCSCYLVSVLSSTKHLWEACIGSCRWQRIARGLLFKGAAAI
jgi:hypothetical protein